MMLERRTQPVESLIVRNWAKHDELWIADVQRHAVQHFPAGFEPCRLDIRGQTHGGTKQLTRAIPFKSGQCLDAAFGLDGEFER